MKTPKSIKNVFRAGALAGLATVITLASIATPAPAQARNSHRHQRLQHRFEVPRTMHRSHRQRYTAYYTGRSYYRPHRHVHLVYQFPVWTPYGLASRPHAYCDGQLFDQRIAYRGPGISFEYRRSSGGYGDRVYRRDDDSDSSS